MTDPQWRWLTAHRLLEDWLQEQQWGTGQDRISRARLAFIDDFFSHRPPGYPAWATEEMRKQADEDRKWAYAMLERRYQWATLGTT